MNTTIHFLPYLTHFFLQWEMLQKKVVEKVKTHISRSETFFFFSKIVLFMDNVE